MLVSDAAQTCSFLERKGKEKLAAEESALLWKKQQEYARIKKRREQMEVRQMMENYYPWGTHHQQEKPRGLRNLRLDGLFPHQDYEKAKRSVLGMGSPGGGAPNVNASGARMCRTKEDPLLRFQWGKDLRKCVDNTLRYRMSKEEQQQYKKELDKLVEEKFKQKEKQRLEDYAKDKIETSNRGHSLLEKIERDTESHAKRIRYGEFISKKTTLRPPNQITKNERVLYPSSKCGHNNYYNANTKQVSFVTPTKSLTSINGNNLKNQLYPPSATKEEENSKENGIELVPLMIKKRSPLKIPLSTTDVTKNGYVCTPMQRWVLDGQHYLQELHKQMNFKVQQLKESRREEADGSRKHFATLNNFWGRPGHGAPRSSIKKTSIDKLLYYGNCSNQMEREENSIYQNVRPMITIA